MKPARRAARPLVLALGFAFGAKASLATPPAAQDYVLECRGCHGADGTGTPGRVPSLAQAARFLATPAGRAYLVRVPGVAGSQLGDARLAALLDWVLRNLATDPPAPAEFEPFTEAEVARLRATPLRDPGRARADILGSALP